MAAETLLSEMISLLLPQIPVPARSSFTSAVPTFINCLSFWCLWIVLSSPAWELSVTVQPGTWDLSNPSLRSGHKEWAFPLLTDPQYLTPSPSRSGEISHQRPCILPFPTIYSWAWTFRKERKKYYFQETSAFCSAYTTLKQGSTKSRATFLG